MHANSYCFVLISLCALFLVSDSARFEGMDGILYEQSEDSLKEAFKLISRMDELELFKTLYELWQKDEELVEDVREAALSVKPILYPFVRELEDDFEDAINSVEFAFVDWYSLGCPQCDQLLPEFGKVSEELHDIVGFFSIDCMRYRELAMANDVKGFPSLTLFENGKPVQYMGERTAQAMSKWIKKRMSPPAKILKTAKEIDEFTKKQPSIVGFFSPDQLKSEAHDAFLKAARSAEFDFIEFGETTLPSPDTKTTPSAKYFRGDDFGSGVIFPSKKYTNFETEFSKWISHSNIPLLDLISPSNFRRYSKFGAPLFVAFLDLDNDKESDPIINALRESAEKHFEDYNFGYINGKTHLEMAVRWGATGTKVPVLMYLTLSEEKNLVFDEEKELTPQALKSWVDAVVRREIVYEPRSEPIPVSNEGPVIKVVGKTLQEIVNQDKDVVLELYAPSLLERVADKVKDEGVVLAKVDATVNSVVVPTQEFPSIIFYPKDNKGQAVVFSGERNLDILENWIKTHSTKRIEEVVQKDEL